MDFESVLDRPEDQSLVTCGLNVHRTKARLKEHINTPLCIRHPTCVLQPSHNHTPHITETIILIHAKIASPQDMMHFSYTFYTLFLGFNTDFSVANVSVYTFHSTHHRTGASSAIFPSISSSLDRSQSINDMSHFYISYFWYIFLCQFV